MHCFVNHQVDTEHPHVTQQDIQLKCDWFIVQVTHNTVFLGSKITMDGDCSHEIKRYLLLARKAMANLDSVLKSRDIALLTKVHIVKAMVFPVVMDGCESWGIKKAECLTKKNSRMTVHSFLVRSLELKNHIILVAIWLQWPSSLSTKNYPPASWHRIHWRPFVKTSGVLGSDKMWHKHYYL